MFSGLYERGPNYFRLATGVPLLPLFESPAIGGGVEGKTLLGWVRARTGHPIHLWTLESAHRLMIKRPRSNSFSQSLPLLPLLSCVVIKPPPVSGRPTPVLPAPPPQGCSPFLRLVLAASADKEICFTGELGVAGDGGSVPGQARLEHPRRLPPAHVKAATDQAGVTGYKGS